MASLFVYPSATPVSAGNSYASSKLYFYRPGTTTLITVYSTSALDPAAVLTNPVVASATGVFAPIWIDESTNPSYRMIHKTAAGATISDKDNLLSSLSYWPRTADEISASVTPSNYRYEPGDIRRYGATGDGVTDDTAAFTAAALSCDHVAVPAGDYLLSDSISLRAGSVIEMSNAATLKASVRDWASLGVLRCVNVSNVTIRGGNIDGQKAGNATGECFGIDLRGADNIRIEGVRIINMPGSTTAGITGGDGIYVGYNSAATDPSTNVLITGCILDGNCRQGISVTGGVGITIVGNQVINATGTGPGGGIDIEADGATDYLRDIQIVGNRIEGNYYGVIVTTAARNVTVVGNTIRDNGYIDIDIADCSHVTVMGNTVESVAKDTPTALVEVRSAQYVNIIGNIIKGKQSASDEREAIRVLVGDYVVISNNNISTMRTQAITVGSSGQTANFTDIIVESNLCVDNVAAGVAATAVIAISGNSGGGFYPSRVFVRDNHIIDTRTGGDEADEALGVATAIPAATRATYRLEGNTVSGPASTMVGGTYPPLSLGFAWDPGSLNDAAGETSAAQTVTGAALGDSVEVYPPYDLQGITCTGYVSATDAVKVRLQNESGGTVDLGSGTWRVRVRKFFE